MTARELVRALVGLAVILTIACNSGDSEDPIPDQIQPATRQAEDPRSPSTGSGANGARHLEPALPTAPGPLTQPSAPPFLGLRSWEPLSAGSIITVAGAGPLGDGAPAKNARLSFPWGVAVVWLPGASARWLGRVSAGSAVMADLPPKPNSTRREAWRSTLTETC